jgi:hypothetical protein
MLDLDINEQPLTHESLTQYVIARMGKPLLLRTKFVTIDPENGRLVVLLDEQGKNCLSMVYNKELEYDLIDIKDTFKVPGRNILDLEENSNDFVIHLLYKDNMIQVDDLEEYDHFINSDLNKFKTTMLWVILCFLCCLAIFLWLLFTI